MKHALEVKLPESGRDEWSRHWLNPTSGRFSPAITDPVCSLEEIIGLIPQLSGLSYGVDTPYSVRREFCLAVELLRRSSIFAASQTESILNLSGDWPALKMDAHAFPGTATPNRMEAFVLPHLHIISFKLSFPVPQNLLESK